MNEQDMQLLGKWLLENQEHKLSWLEKEAVKTAISKAKTIGDLAEMALQLLRK